MTEKQKWGGAIPYIENESQSTSTYIHRSTEHEHENEYYIVSINRIDRRLILS